MGIKILISCCLATSLCLSQDVEYRKYKYDWGTEKPLPIAVEEQFKNGDAVILNEENSITCDFSSAKYFIGYYNYLKIYTPDYFVTKKIRIKILTNKGKIDFSSVTLPESFDKQFDYKNVSVRNRSTSHFPQLYDNRVLYFSARIIKSSGEVVYPIIKDSVITVKKIQDHNEFYNSFSYNYNIPNLEVNDELEFVYKEFLPDYLYFSSNRFYFHDTYPKQNYSLSVAYTAFSIPVFQNRNGAETNFDTISEIRDKERWITRVWHRKNLSGVPKLENSILINDAPFVSFYFFSRKLFEILPNANRTQPYTWAYALSYYIDYRSKDQEYYYNKPDVYTSSLNDFFAETTKGIVDSTGGAQKLNAIHNTINKFKFITDQSVYAEKFNPITRPGVYLRNKEFRETYVYQTYYELLHRLNISYYEVFLSDKRIYSIRSEFFSPQLDNTVAYSSKYNKKNYNYAPKITDSESFLPVLSKSAAYCILDHKYFNYFLPKCSQNGFFMNEMPFYFEDTKSILVPQNLPPKELKTDVRNENILFVSTSGSFTDDNQRRTNLMCNVSLDSNKIRFNGGVSLSGQFSTMTRGVYINGQCDSSISTKYSQRIYDLDSKTVVNKSKVVNVAEVFPFKAQIAVSYQSDALIKKEADGNYSIDLNKWFKYIYEENFKTSEHPFPYYPDFKNRDSYKYNLIFDKKVTCVNCENALVSIENEFGSFTFKANQWDENTILLESFLQVGTSKVESEKLKDIEDIYRKIDGINNLKILVKASN